MAIIVATLRPKKIDEFLTALAEASQEEILIETSGADTIKQVKVTTPKLVVVDGGLPDFEPLKLVMEIIKISAMTNTAVVTSMTAEDFHEASEGYGVLVGLPINPGKTDGVELVELLGRV